MNTNFPSLTPEEITRIGQETYLNELKENLEQSHLGEYVVIEVKTKKYFINPDLVTAIQKAKKEFPDSLFFIVQIGKLQTPSIQQKKESYAWLF